MSEVESGDPDHSINEINQTSVECDETSLPDPRALHVGESVVEKLTEAYPFALDRLDDDGGRDLRAR